MAKHRSGAWERRSGQWSARAGHAARSAGLLLAACSTLDLSAASVEVPEPIDASCASSTLRSTDGVFDVQPERGGGQKSLRFRATVPGVDRDDALYYYVRQTADAGGTHTFRVDGSIAGRGSTLEKERALPSDLLRRIVEACSGYTVEFGPQHICGKGEKNSRCVTGTLKRR